MMQRCMKVAWLGMLIALGGLVFAAPGYAITLSFTQCPAVGADTTGCEFLITQSGSGFVTTASIPDKGPYDGIEDTLIGFQNNTTGPVSSLPLSSTASANGGIFNFDGDGACTFITCTGGDSTGYGGFVSTNMTGVTGIAGNNVTYGSIAANHQSGTVFFTGGVPAGGSAWFSLEDVISVNTITPGGGGAVPEPSTLLLIGTGLVGLVRLRMK